jgi:hypothetical protein
VHSRFTRHAAFIIGVALFLFAAVAQGEINETDAADDDHSSRHVSTSHTRLVDSPRTKALIERARDEDWSADQLFAYLELDHSQGCRHFGDRTYLRERHAQWREAVGLLALVDRERLDSWLLGLTQPPSTPSGEVNDQLRCLVAELVDAAQGDQFDIRLFRSIQAHFGGRYRSASALAEAIKENDRLLDRTADALTRSIFRNIHTQGFIWYRKFRFTGRPFNRISEEAAQTCRLGPGGIWNPDNERHHRCWTRTLTPEEREWEILQASAAPGLSRHHWGTDLDILGLNPVFFAEGGALYGDWRWLDANALDHGFFQPYVDFEDDRIAHMEERWHWSYYPIAQALWEYIYDNQSYFEAILFDRWDSLERQWGPGRGPYFGHMRQYWRDYLFNIDVPSADAESDMRSLTSETKKER